MSDDSVSTVAVEATADDPVQRLPVLVGELVSADPAPVVPRKDGRFYPGDPRISKGRPKGAKSLLGHNFVKDLAKWHKKHGYKAIEKVGREKPEKLLEILASLIPKHDILETIHHDGAPVTTLGLQELDRRLEAIIERGKQVTDPNPLPK